MRTIVRPGATRAVLATAALAGLMLVAPARSGAGPRLRPGLEAGALWGGMSGADRFATGGGDAKGHTGNFAAALVELAWSDRWGLATGLRYREVRETAPTGLQVSSLGLDYAYRLHSTLDLVSLPALARLRPLPFSALALELGPQLTWVTHAESAITLDLIGASPGPAPSRGGPARPEAQIFESLTSGLTAEYRNVILEGVAALVLETPGMAHPAFVTLRYTGGLTGLVASSRGGERRTMVFELGAGWHW
jgi:hypothetical protein